MGLVLLERLTRWGFGPLISAGPDLLTSKERVRLETGAIFKKKKKNLWALGSFLVGEYLDGRVPYPLPEG